MSIHVAVGLVPVKRFDKRVFISYKKESYKTVYYSTSAAVSITSKVR